MEIHSKLFPRWFFAVLLSSEQRFLKGKFQMVSSSQMQTCLSFLAINLMHLRLVGANLVN